MPFPSPGDLPDPGIEPGTPALQADCLLCEPPEKSGSGVGVWTQFSYNNIQAWKLVQGTPSSLHSFSPQRQLLFLVLNLYPLQTVPKYY